MALSLPFSLEDICNEVGISTTSSLAQCVAASTLSDKTAPHSFSQFNGYSHVLPPNITSSQVFSRNSSCSFVYKTNETSGWPGYQYGYNAVAQLRLLYNNYDLIDPTKTAYNVSWSTGSTTVSGASGSKVVGTVKVLWNTYTTYTYCSVQKNSSTQFPNGTVTIKYTTSSTGLSIRNSNFTVSVSAGNCTTSGFFLVQEDGDDIFSAPDSIDSDLVGVAMSIGLEHIL